MPCLEFTEFRCHPPQCRFWTQFEAWLALQVPTADGLKGTNIDELANRCSIVPIYNANSSMAHCLRSMWANKSAEEAYDILRQGDVTVTNQSDKAQQLPKIRTLDEDVRAVLQGEE